MKLFFFDYDSTIYAHGSAGVSPRVENALHSLQQAGHKIILCTGRCEGHLPQEAVRIGFDGYATCCGASMFLDGAHIAVQPLPVQLVFDIMQLAEALQLDGAVEGEKRVLFYNKKSPEARIPEVHSFAEYAAAFREMKVYKFTFHNPPMPEKMYRFLQANDLYVINNNNIYYEVVRNGHLKGKAVRDVAAYYGVDICDTYCFGDSSNDADMLRTAGTSIVVANAPADVQALASEVVPSVYEDGVAQWIENFLTK